MNATLVISVTAVVMAIAITIAVFFKITGDADAHLNNYKVSFTTEHSYPDGTVYATGSGTIVDSIGEICADLSTDDYSEVSKLCIDFGSDGADLGLDDYIICDGEMKDEDFEYLGEAEDYDGVYFTMREILESDDVEAKYEEVKERCIAGSGTERNLLRDYGWCSGNALFIAGFAGDSSNYCDPSQRCDSHAGCGGSLEKCCIQHDKCLQATDGTSKCQKTNCRGRTCDSHLSSCAWSKTCSYKYKCGWWKCWGYDPVCGTVLSAITAGFGISSSPQSGWNTGGANTHGCCDGSC
ncbi:hypothetical protein TrVE_jg8631 [Triparma verrucosa]|uniref:Uncharacterized protein n=1 Tax=Triparma verrucosa TaxID=1606542 RepID=A0A9W7FG91_9STRA|nr:hypothetical protein TrVE_jg8631 [Triparma verrucosa]